MKKKILLTGGYGFLGNQVFNELSIKYNVIRFRSAEVDLTEIKVFDAYLKKIQPDVVINMAARLGGIGDNIKNPLAYYETNLNIGLNLLDACKRHELEHVINIGTVCSYPKRPSIPFLEDELWNGLPEESNMYYGLAKRTIIDYGMVLNKVNNMPISNLLLANLYGIGDDFRDKTSHVIPAIIKKVESLNPDDILEVWGDGTPTRDFLNVKDAARIIREFVDQGFKISSPINIGTGIETSINEVVSIILTNYKKTKNKINHKITKPNGQPRRVLNIEKLVNLYSVKTEIRIKEGIEETINWYKSNKKHIVKY